MITSANYHVTGVGRYLPQKSLTNAELETLIDTNDEWIRKRTGICERFISAEDEFASNLAIEAVHNMLETHPVTVEDADMVIVSSLLPDHYTPSTAALVAGHFGIRGAGTYDLHAACTGYAYGFITAVSYLASGIANKVLLISAETLSKAVDYTDRGTCILFGDAAVATLIEYGEAPKRFVCNSGTDGDLADKLYCTAFSDRIDGKKLDNIGYIWQDGGNVYEYVLKHVSRHICELMDEAQMKASDIDWFVPHSANFRMINALRKRVGFTSEQMLTSVEAYGNTSSASIPLAISRALQEGKIKRGDKVLIYGFGGGLTYAGAIWEW